MREARKRNGFTPTPIYIVAAKLNKTPKTALAGCQNAQPKCKLVRGFSLVEMMIAFAIIVIIFAAIVPQFRAIRNSWTSNEAKAETLQNGRVLAEHIARSLAAAKQIVAVSPDSSTNGFITFKDNNDVQKRYMLTGGYVVFGNLGSEAQLAGPVDRFQIRCYSLSDLNTPTTDANIIRLVQVDTDFPNDDVMGTDKTFTTSVYLRTNANTYGLVGWWKLDETSGLTAADGSGSGNNGTLVNGPSWTTGQIGGSLVFDGSDDYVNLGTGSSLNFGSSAPFTVAAWVKTTENYGMIVSFRSSTDGGPVIDLAVGKDDVDEDNGKAMILVRQNGGSGGYAKLKGNSSMNDGQWHHIVGVRGSGSTIELFLDGVSQGTDSGSQSGGAITTNLRAIGSERRWVSDGYGTADQRYLAGTIDDVRIYNRVLTAAEIAQLANTLQYKAFNEAKAASDSNTSVTISTPATSSGDLLITAVATDGDTSTTIAAPSGWTLINRGANGSVVTLGAWWKIAGSSEPASHAFTWTGGQQAYGWMMRFSGHNAANPINGTPVTANQTSSTPTSPAVTTTVNNCIILRLGAFDDDAITVDNPGLSGHTTITADESASSAGTGPVEILGSWIPDLTHAKETGTNRALVFTAHARHDSAISLTSVTYGGRAMTKIVEASHSSGNPRYTAAFILNDAGITAATTTTFTPTWSVTPTREAYSSVFLQNVNQTTLTGATAGNATDSGATITTSALANSSGDMVIEAATSKDTGTYTANNGFTKALELTMTNNDGMAGYKAATGANLTPSVTHTVATVQSLIGFVVKGGVSGGTVSGGAGYVKQSAAGSSGTSTFTLGSSNEARTLTIAIAPDSNTSGDNEIRP